jgi:hypothetical protein
MTCIEAGVCAVPAKRGRYPFASGWRPAGAVPSGAVCAVPEISARVRELSLSEIEPL